MNIITPLHKRTERDYIGRMQESKVACMRIARKYDEQFWDGDRRYGYGGYRYDGRWEPVASELIRRYHLPQDARIVDVGCGKGYLLYEFRKLLPDCDISGFDISQYAIEHSKEEAKGDLFVHRAQDPYPFDDGSFDLVVSITTLHNLPVYEVKSAVQEIERVGKNGYIALESYRDERELFNLQCWALTCESFFTPREWVWLYDEFGYTGDYEFIYFDCIR